MTIFTGLSHTITVIFATLSAMTQKQQNSPYDDIPRLVTGANPKRWEHLSQLDALQHSLARYKRMPKRTEDGRVDAKTAFAALLAAFDATTPKTLEPQAELIEHPSLTDQLAATQRGQQNALFTTESSPEAARAEATQAMHALGDAIYARRALIQPKRPRIQKEPEVLKQINVDLYAPFIRAFAASYAKDRETPRSQQALAAMPTLSQVAREAQGVVAMLDFSDSIDRFRKKLQRKADEQGVDVKFLFQENAAELKPHLLKICDTFNNKIRALDLTVKGQPAGYKMTPAYEACVAAETSIRHAERFTQIIPPRDAVKHYAFQFVLGGKDLNSDYVHHKLAHRIEDAYQADLAIYKKKLACAEKAHVRAVDHNPRTAGTFTPPLNPLEENLHTLNRVYEARWAMIADDMVTLAGAKFLADPKIAHPSATPPEEYSGEVAAKPRRPTTRVQSITPEGRSAVAPSAARSRGGKQPANN